MMSRKSSNEIKNVLQTGDIIASWERLRAYIEERYRVLAAIALSVCVVAAGAGLWVVQQNKMEKKAHGLFNRAMYMMEREADTPQKQETAYRQALAALQEVINSFSGTKAGDTALFYAGSCCYGLREYDKAVSYYRAFIEKAEDSLSYLVPFAYESLGYAYEEKGEYDKALEWFDKQRNLDAGFGSSLSLLNLARCYDQMGESEKACALYKDFSENNPDSSFTELAVIMTERTCNTSSSPLSSGS